MLSLKILSAEECSDKVYGESIVQYQIGDCITSFLFSSMDAKEALTSPKQLFIEFCEKEISFAIMPLWSTLSPKLQEAILDNPFDMQFFEYDDPNWSQASADAVWEELRRIPANIPVTCGEDGCLVTVYAGAMSAINWFGHPVYSKPCLQHKNPMFDKPPLGEIIQAAEQKTAAQHFCASPKEKQDELKR